MRRKGFTLIELLVVIAIIAILAAILFPVLARAKQKGNQSKCLVHMAEIGKAMMVYSDDYQGNLPCAWSSTGGWDAWWDTWRERLLKYTRGRKIFYCPVRTAAPRSPDRSMGHYGMNVYITMDDQEAGYVGFSKVSQIPIPTKTIMVSENKDGDWSAEPWHNGGTGDAGQFYPYHGDEYMRGGNFIFCDAHAKYMSVKDTEYRNFWYWHKKKW